MSVGFAALDIDGALPVVGLAPPPGIAFLPVCAFIRIDKVAREIGNQRAAPRHRELCSDAFLDSSVVVVRKGDFTAEL